MTPQPTNLCDCGAPLQWGARWHPAQPEGVLICTDIYCNATWLPDAEDAPEPEVEQ